MMYWTSDYHLGHARIIEYCNRPFQDVHDMDDKIIWNHNRTVMKNDTVFFLGDFCFSNLAPYWERLNGNLIWIEGNHDRRLSMPYRMRNATVKVNGKRVYMTHSEINVTDEIKENHDMVFVGHSHNTWQFKTKLINVSCDNWKFKPVKFDYLIRRYKAWERTNGQRT